MAYDLVIRNGTIINARETLDADLAIAGERIAAIGIGLRGQAEIDASGLFVLPGAIDGHVHLDNPNLPPYDPPTADTFTSGSIAAAFGGVTTLIDFAQPKAGQSLVEELESRKADAQGKSVVDYGLHMNFRDPDPGRLKEIAAVFERGVPSFKLFMAYDGYRLADVVLYRVMQAIAEHNGLAIIHAENFDIVQEIKGRLAAEGRTGLHWHGTAYPAVIEGAAIHEILALAQLAGTRALIYHVSCAEGVRELRLAKARGQAVYGETCPHYLTYTHEVYENENIVAQSLAVVPPIRDASHQEALWQGLGEGDIDIVSTDHCPRPYQEGQTRQRPGTSGLETRLALMHTLGVKAGHISPNRWVETCCTRPAEVFGIPAKGHLAPGYDADVVLFDPTKEMTFSAKVLHSPLPFSSYEGITVSGYPITIMSRGKVIVEDGALVAEPGWGRFVEREYRPQHCL